MITSFRPCILRSAQVCVSLSNALLLAHIKDQGTYIRKSRKARMQQTEPLGSGNCIARHMDFVSRGTWTLYAPMDISLNEWGSV